MRRSLVFLTVLLLSSPTWGQAGDLYLVRIVSVDKEMQQVVADIVEGPARAGTTRVRIQHAPIAEDARPGDLVRLWGEIGQGNGVLIVDRVAAPPGADPTGVRRRLRNNIQTHGQGGRGRGHGR